MTEEKEKSESGRKIVVRLLNGVLRGCEFNLLAGKTLFILSDEQSFRQQHESTILPENIIYIPSRQDNAHFEILVPEDAGQPIILREILEETITEVEFSPDEIITVKAQKLAWRETHATFSDEVLYGQAEMVLPTDETEDESAGPRPRKQWWKGLVALGIVGCLTFSGYIYLTETQRQIESISDVLENSIGDYLLVYGDDKVIYVLADNEKSAQWAIQSLVRKPQPYRTKVLTLSAEEQRIARWIESNWPLVKFHRVRLDNPKQPILEVSAERTKLSDAEKIMFISSLIKEIAYASEVKIRDIEDDKIKKLAVDGLKKMALEFTEIDNTHSVTFVIRGAIEDDELERLKKFITLYYQLWGNEYVQFALELRDDWLKGKSYKYGSQGYVKLAPGHWYFPRSLQKEL